MKNPYYKIKCGLKNFWIYRKLIWNDRHWDQAFLYNMLAFKLEEMSKFFEKHSYWTEKEEQVKLMKSASEMCKRIARENYCEKEWDEHARKFPSKYNFIPLENRPSLSKLEIEYENPKAKKEADEDSSRIFKLEEELITKDINDLFEILKEHSRGWWD